MKTKAQKKYAQYLKSEHWQNLRNTILVQRGNRCEVCGSLENLCVHHQTYCRIGKERDKDLIVLCRSCHKRVHSTSKLNVKKALKCKPKKKKIKKELSPEECDLFNLRRRCKNLGIKVYFSEDKSHWVELLRILFEAHNLKVPDYITPEQAKLQLKLYISMTPYQRLKTYNNLSNP